MRRLIALAAAMVAGLVTMAHPVQAKFNVRVIIDGPGLVEPIELPNTAVRIGCLFVKPCRSLANPPVRSLGPRFTVTQSLEGHHARGLMMDRIVHDLYPYARGGAWVFTPPGQTWHDWSRIRRVPGGWTPAHRSLMRAVQANGLPSQPPIERILAAPAAIKETQVRGPDEAGILIGVGLLLAAGAIIRRPRRRRTGGA